MQTKLLVLGFSLFAIHSTKLPVDAALDCKNIADDAQITLRLRKDLFCHYDPVIRPKIDGGRNSMVVLSLHPKYIDFDDSTNTFTLQAWMGVAWENEYLQWMSKKYARSVHRLYVSSDEIWTPPITLYNSAEVGYNAQTGIPKTKCLLFMYGYTFCRPLVKFVTHCASDYWNWPFDRHNCTIFLGSWIYKAKDIRYIHMTTQYNSTESMLFDFIPNNEWKMLSIDRASRLDGFPEVNYTFPTIIYSVIIERHSTFMQTTILAPAVLLIVMTLTVLWLSPDAVERLVLAILNLICHLICVMDVNWQVPSNGLTTPSILVFHHSSIVIASFALFLTVVLRQLKEISVTAPDWLLSTSSAITRAGRSFPLINLKSEAAAPIQAEEDEVGVASSNGPSVKINPRSSNAWQHLATLLNRLAFTFVLLAYIIMIHVLVPKEDVNGVPDALPYRKDDLVL
ncbi:acetylcholine receptor subunit alpha-L1-like [Diprion similis]|uniref:acetylcholine receptor subunit alpha-L1-like n=1 Tax=Diprion similis TaxID=362088 RepID=UPI001EF8EB60|nr:acetylcholine receptor subunit alpha-L1-like [Diprion similis]